LDKCAKAEALGYTGVVGVNLLGPAGAHIVQLDACCSNGRTHDELPYYGTPNIVAELQRNLLWQPVESREGERGFSLAHPLALCPSRLPFLMAVWYRPRNFSYRSTIAVSCKASRLPSRCAPSADACSAWNGISIAWSGRWRFSD